MKKCTKTGPTFGGPKNGPATQYQFDFFSRARFFKALLDPKSGSCFWLLGIFASHANFCHAVMQQLQHLTPTIKKQSWLASCINTQRRPTPTPTVRDIPQPGTTTSTGALVALDEHPRMEILQYGGPTFADRYLTFKRGLEQEVDKLLLTQRSKMSTVSGKWISLRCPSPFPMMHKMAWVRSQAMAFNVVACRQTQQLME